MEGESKEIRNLRPYWNAYLAEGHPGICERDLMPKPKTKSQSKQTKTLRRAGRICIEEVRKMHNLNKTYGGA